MIRIPSVLFSLVGMLAAQHDELIEALSSPKRAREAQIELFRRGSDVALPLARLLSQSPRERAREGIARAAMARVLTDLGPRALPAFVPLVDCLREPNLPADTIAHAASVLVVIAPFAGEQKQELIDGLTEACSSRQTIWRSGFREVYRQILASTELDAAGAKLPVLFEYLAGENPYAAATACRALSVRRAEFRGRADEVIAALRAAVRRVYDEVDVWQTQSGNRWATWKVGDVSVRWLRTQASLALIDYVPEDDLTVLGQSQRLFSLDPQVSQDAAKALGELGVPDSGQWLLECALTSVPEVALSALRALQKLGPDVRYLVPQFVEFEAAASQPVREMAVLTRRVIAPDIERVRPIAPTFELLVCGIPDDSEVRLDAERARLIAWLDADGGKNRYALQDDVRHIDRFHADAARGPVHEDMRWVPVRIGPAVLDPNRWRPSMGERFSVVSAAPTGVIGAQRARLRSLPWIVELFPAVQGGPHLTRESLLGVRETRRNGFSIRVKAAHGQVMVDLKVDSAWREQPILCVVDGLVVWTHNWRFQAGFVPNVMGFGYLPGATDRRTAVRAMID